MAVPLHRLHLHTARSHDGRGSFGGEESWARVHILYSVIIDIGDRFCSGSTSLTRVVIVQLIRDIWNSST